MLLRAGLGSTNPSGGKRQLPKVYWQALEGLNVFFVAAKDMESCPAFRFEIGKAAAV